jgi:hypothetical protein
MGAEGERVIVPPESGVRRRGRTSTQRSAMVAAALALVAVFPTGARARVSTWRIQSYSLTFSEHATATTSPCGQPASTSQRATSEDARFTLDHWTYPRIVTSHGPQGRYRGPLFQYEPSFHGPFAEEVGVEYAVTEHRHVTQTVVNCDTQTTSPRACDSSSPYRSASGPWGTIESMVANARAHRVTVEWGLPPSAVNGAFDCDGDVGLGPPVPRDDFVRTRLPLRAFYKTRTRIHFSRTWSGNDGAGTAGTETLSGTLVLRRTADRAKCDPGRHPDRHFVCTRR